MLKEWAFAQKLSETWYCLCTGCDGGFNSGHFPVMTAHKRAFSNKWSLTNVQSEAIFQVGQANLFQIGSPAIRALRSGWSEPEATHVWNNGAMARLNFRVAAARTVRGMQIVAQPYLGNGLRAQRVQIFLGGLFVHGLVFDNDKPVRFELPERVRGEPLWDLAFFMSDATQPAGDGDGDKRYLALALREMTLLAEV